MALSFFKQRDIDEMDPYDIPDEFVNYFDSLSDGQKSEIINSRPELAAGLGYSIPIIDKMGTVENEDVKETELKGAEGITSEDVEEFSKEVIDEFAQIRENLYADADLDKVLVDGMNLLEVLTISENVDTCRVHRKRFEEKNIRYRSNSGSVYSIVLFVCRDCKRVFQKESRIELVGQKLRERNIQYISYDLDLSTRYLRSQMSSYVMEDDEKVYVPDVWIEEKPTCPIHGCELFELSCEKNFSGRNVSFKGHFCDKCNKVLVRKSLAYDLVDQCAVAGVPEIEIEALVNEMPIKKALPKKEIKPDYFIQDGKQIEYNYAHMTDCYKLTEEDTVVITDSIYCNVEGHNTKEVLAMIMVNQKRGGRKAYLFLVGYCTHCQKYYMDEVDYRVVYSVGRPEVTILSDLDGDSYKITSGEVFSLEKNHLGELESDIDSEIISIQNSRDYINPFSVGDYDDGGLAYAKRKSKQKYGERLKILEGYKPKPYSYRVDITSNGKTEIYYVGAADIDLPDGRRVISFNSDFGHELVNYQTIKVKKDGKEYDIKLSRQFDIENEVLYGYTNLRTNEDIIFRSGITDPFLVRVLNMRKKQHNLIDIVATIQEKQNRIVDTEFNKNIIVQGCAGSGKTMVLLHRLSSLKYKYQQFDFGKFAMILTPNDQFSLHIKGVADELQIGGISRMSVEQYYVDMLLRYSEEFKPNNRLVSEMDVKQIFVDYVYSDQFMQDFDAAYEQVIIKRNSLVNMLDHLTEVMNQPSRNIDLSNDSKVIVQIKYVVESMDGLVKQQEQKIGEVKAKIEKGESRRAFLEQKLPELEKLVSERVHEALARVYTKIGERVFERKQTISNLEVQIGNLVTESEHVQRAFLVLEKKAKLEKLDKEVQKHIRSKNSETKKQEDENAVFMVSLEGKSDDEIVDWMRRVMFFIPQVQDEVKLYKNAREAFKKYIAEMSKLDSAIDSAKNYYEKMSLNVYSEEVKEIINYLKSSILEYSVIGTYQKVFNETVGKFKKDNCITMIRGRHHRYDLYAELLFAKKYYKETYGEIRFMFIDEGQDLAFNEYRLIRELNQENLVFNIFGDTNQLIKPGRGIADWTELEHMISAEKYLLEENYRNTNQITRFCNSSFGMNVLQTGVDGANVREIARGELEKELTSLNISSERIAILVPRIVIKEKYLDMNLLSDKIRDIIGNNMGNGYISLMYVDEVKGIEFDKVYVICKRMTRNEKYIAYTRALSDLIIVVDENIFDIEEGSE